MPAQDLQSDPALGQLVDEIDQMAQVAAEPIELPGDQHVALTQGLEAGGEAGPVVALAGGVIFVEVLGCHLSGEQRIQLLP